MGYTLADFVEAVREQRKLALERRERAHKRSVASNLNVARSAYLDSREALAAMMAYGHVLQIGEDMKLWPKEALQEVK